MTEVIHGGLRDQPLHHHSFVLSFISL